MSSLLEKTRRWGKLRVLVFVVVSAVVIGGVALILERGKSPPPSSPSLDDAHDRSVRTRAPARAPIGRATVAIYDDGQPLVDRWVVFHDADGAVTATMKSGADGKASSDVVSTESMITVAYGTSVRHLFTVVGVHPGDEVTVGEREDDEGEPANTVAMAKVVLPGRFPSATRYGVSLGVGMTDVADVTAAQRMPVLKRLLSPSRQFSVLALAFEDPRSDAAAAFAFGRGALAGGGDGGGNDASSTRDVEARLPAWSKDWREHRIVLSGVPHGATKVVGELAIVAGENARFERGRREIDTADAAAADNNNALQFTVPQPLDGDPSVLRLEVLYGTSGDKTTFARRSKSIPKDLSLDLHQILLPRVSNAVIDRDGDNKSIVGVRWTVAAKEDGGGGDLSKADAAVVQLSWPETKEHVWTIVTPPTTSHQALPTLPDVLAEWRPTVVSSIRAAVALIESSECAGYDDVRKKGIHVALEFPDEDDMTNRRSTTGDIVF